MKKELIWLIPIIILLMICTASFILLKKSNTKLKADFAMLNEYMQQSKSKWSESYLFSMSGSGRDLSGLEIVNGIGEEYSLDSLFNARKNVFVLYFNEVTCNTCIEDELKLFIDEFKEFQNGEVIVFASYDHIRDLSVFVRVNKIPFPVYKVSQQIKLGNTAVIKEPTYFLLNHEGKITNIVPIDEDLWGMRSGYYGLCKTLLKATDK